MGTECANPLLLQWIGEWLETAKQRNTKGIQTYKKAYDSMKACPLRFDHPSQAQQLNGLGPKLCDRLTDKLKVHCIENGLPALEAPHKGQKHAADDGNNETAPPKKARKSKPYVPTLRSGPYAIIVALSSVREDSSHGLTKAETIEFAQSQCDSSFTAPSDPTKFYTAWNSMKTLIEKDLVYERGRPLRKYALTEDGWEVAKRIKKTMDGNTAVLERIASQNPGVEHRVEKTALDERTDSELASGQRLGALHDKEISTRTSSVGKAVRSAQEIDFLELLSSSPPVPNATSRKLAVSTVTNDLESTDSASGVSASRRDKDPSLDVDFPYAGHSGIQSLLLAPGTFTVELVLDNREVRAKTDRDYIQEELSKKGVKPLMRSLELGDALWVAKCNDPRTLERVGEEGDEVVLDWIVERKRLDDLVGSIKDGRFHEQKFRLRKSGVKNVVYVIEEISMTHEAISKYGEAVQSAIASTQVVNGYFVKKTQKLDDTIRYLARMTLMLQSLYETKPIHIIPTKALTPKNYLPLLSKLRETQPSKSYLITYSAFASLASKSDVLTLRDIFLKMLMCTRGVTGDKALEIQKNWKTPLNFAEAFGKCEDAMERDSLLMKKMGGLVGRKKVGKALSAKVAEVWGD
ncbi:MAG: Crossover junction endonuclease mus81 [Pycnora praestabilis]|nr:MAG: Crossover junction endonuclease mus81 [Pycnora praestabilis]